MTDEKGHTWETEKKIHRGIFTRSPEPSTRFAVRFRSSWALVRENSDASTPQLFPDTRHVRGVAPRTGTISPASFSWGRPGQNLEGWPSNTTTGGAATEKEVSAVAQPERSKGPWWAPPLIAGVIQAVVRFVLDCLKDGYGPS